MQDWIKTLAVQNSSFVSTFNVGKSTENRNVLGIKIGKPNGTKKKSIWIDAGIHAREWIADAVGLFIIAQLIQKYESDANVRNLVDNLDWYIVVAPNPDGYEHSRISVRFFVLFQFEKTIFNSKKMIFRTGCGEKREANSEIHVSGSIRIEILTSIGIRRKDQAAIVIRIITPVPKRFRNPKPKIWPLGLNFWPGNEIYKR